MSKPLGYFNGRDEVVLPSSLEGSEAIKILHYLVSNMSVSGYAQDTELLKTLEHEFKNDYKSVVKWLAQHL